MFFHIVDLNPASKDWDETINQYRNDGKSRIDEDEFASIYEQESNKKTPNVKDMMEAIRAVDPQNGPGN